MNEKSERENSPLLIKRTTLKSKQLSRTPPGETTASQHSKKESSKSICAGEKFWILFALCGSFTVSYSPVSIIITFLPFYLQENYQIYELGNNILFALWPAMYALFCPICGKLALKIGRMKTLMLGWTIICLSIIWFGFAGSVPTLFIARGLQGVGSAFINVSCQSILTDVFYDNVGVAMGFRESFIGATFAGAPFLGGLLYDNLGYRMVFIILALLSAAWGTASMSILYKHRNLTLRDSESSASGELNFKILMNKDILIGCTIVLLAYFPFGAIQPQLQEHFYQTLQLGPTAIGGFYFLQAGVAIFSAPLVGALNRRTDARKILLFGFSLLAIMFFFFGPAPFLQNAFDSFVPMFILQLTCMLTLGIAAVLILTSSYCFMKYVVFQKPTGNAEVLSSLFLFLEGLSQSCSPLIASGIMSVAPRTFLGSCLLQATTKDNETRCYGSFGWTTVFISIFFVFYVMALFLIFPTITYETDEQLSNKKNEEIELEEEI